MRWPSWIALAMAALCSGCVTIAHEAGWLSWYDESAHTRQEAKRVVVTSDPGGARITRRVDAGDPLLIGTTPLVDTLTLEIDERVATPSTGPLWIGAAVEVVGGFALMISGVTSVRSADGELSVGRFLGFGMSGALLVSSGMIDAVAALVHGNKEPRVTSTTRHRELVYTADVPELGEAVAAVRLPDQESAHLAFTPRAEPARRPSTGWVVAVMSVEDTSSSNRFEADAPIMASLGDQMRVFVAQRGIRTVDRGAQEAALKQQISRMKSESYAACYDSSCQIDLGKALAASHILRTRLTRFGTRCVLSGELIDLRSEVTVAAASSQGRCEPEGYLEMSEMVARDLIAAPLTPPSRD